MRRPSRPAATLGRNLHRLAATLGALVLAACASTEENPRLPLGASDTRVEPSLFAQAPADVLVAPIRERGGTWDAPADELRQALYRGLVAKLFSPVRLSVVDGRELNSRGELRLEQGEAVLTTRLVRWDATALDSRGWVDAEVEVELVRAAGEARVTLWRTSLHRRLESDPRQVRRSTRTELARELAQRLAQEILAELPARGALGQPPTPNGAP